MKFLSNIPDPKNPESRMHMNYSYEAFIGGPLAMEQVWKDHMEWVESNVIGRPQATEKYTVEQLEADGVVGIYSKED